MRKLIEATFVSLDGVIESPERWALQHWGAEHRANATRQLESYDAFLFGRVTYEKFAAAWSPITGDPYYDAINRMPKYVASTTLRTTTWNATLLTGDVVDAVRALKQQPGKDIIKYGSGALDRTLIPHQLIDEFPGQLGRLAGKSPRKPWPVVLAIVRLYVTAGVSFGSFEVPNSSVTRSMSKSSFGPRTIWSSRES